MLWAKSIWGLRGIIYFLVLYKTLNPNILLQIPRDTENSSTELLVLNIIIKFNKVRASRCRFENSCIKTIWKPSRIHFWAFLIQFWTIDLEQIYGKLRTLAILQYNDYQGNILHDRLNFLTVPSGLGYILSFGCINQRLLTRGTWELKNPSRGWALKPPPLSPCSAGRKERGVFVNLSRLVP